VECTPGLRQRNRGQVRPAGDCVGVRLTCIGGWPAKRTLLGSNPSRNCRRKLTAMSARPTGETRWPRPLWCGTEELLRPRGRHLERRRDRALDRSLPAAQTIEISGRAAADLAAGYAGRKATGVDHVFTSRSRRSCVAPSVPRDTTLIVRRADAESPLSIDLAQRARHLDFAVRILGWGDRVTFGSFTATALPFYGEQPLAPHALPKRANRNQGSTYHVAGPHGLSALFLADAGSDPSGSSLHLAWAFAEASATLICSSATIAAGGSIRRNHHYLGAAEYLLCPG
jgi:hypothetical protein